MDVPALTSACAKVQGTTAALITDCKYGYRLADGVLSVSLINTAGTPDPYPERGVHAVKVFVALTDGRPVALKQKAEALIRPLTSVSTASHPGSLPPRQSLLRFEAAHSALTSIRICEDGALAIRLYEAEGAEDEITVVLPFAPKRAVLTNLDGEVLSEVPIQENRVCFPAEAHRIAQVKIYA